MGRARREHRVVVLPEYQGMGMGSCLSDAVAALETGLDPGSKYFSKTKHPRFGGYRNASRVWTPTKSNGRIDQFEAKYPGQEKGKPIRVDRQLPSFSHEFIPHHNQDRLAQEYLAQRVLVCDPQGPFPSAQLKHANP